MRRFMDKLKECALSFNNLLNKEYYIKAEKKDKLIEIQLFFAKKHFYHLLGLHKLKDIRQISRNTTNLFDDICSGKITYSDIVSSTFYDEISDRLYYFHNLENILDSEEIIIKYNQNKARSSIEAKYIIYSKINEVNVHYFIDIDENEGKYFGRTFFTRRDYLYLQDKPYKISEKIKYGNGCVISKKELKSTPIESSG